MAHDGILDIIDLMDDFFMVKFSGYSNYEYALIEGPCTIYDYYLTICKWN